MNPAIRGKLLSVAAAGLVTMAITACSPGASSGAGEEYCGHSFCIDGVADEAVTVTMPVIDVRIYEIRTTAGLLVLVESNFPDIDDLEQKVAADLPNLKAWDLSPTTIPVCLIFVGAKWPHWMVASMEGEDVEREDLVEYLRGLRITATPTTTMEGIEFPVFQEPKTN